MRNGMSVKEIYEALDERDRLKNALQKEREANAKLESSIGKALWYICENADDYNNLARFHCDAKADKIEFHAKASGLLEAVSIIKRYINKSDNETEGEL